MEGKGGYKEVTEGGQAHTWTEPVESKRKDK
jgi:hypothetical protein